MDKGQHLRLLLTSGTSGSTKRVFALGIGLAFHLSAATEDSTTKDTTDTDDTWNEYEVTQRSGDIQIDALIGSGTDSAAETLNDVIDAVNDTPVNWELAIVSGTNNRAVASTICTGQGKLTNVSPQGQNRQNAQYSATLNIYGPVTVA
ncbi:MAG: hypothetical protein II822_10455 [Prevotella sp.]|nr:hypothetical protein [Prevotella sp.]